MHVTKHGKSKLTNCYANIGHACSFFFSLNAGELHIIALKEEELGQNSHTTQPPHAPKTHTPHHETLGM